MKMTSYLQLTLVSSLLFAGAAEAQGKLSLSKSGRTVDHTCPAGGDVAIAGSRNAITLHGPCRKISIMGSGNTLRIESAEKLAISGSRNEVDASTMSKIDVSGNDNRVHYVAAREGKAKASSSGKNNSIQQVASLDAAPPPTQDKPAADKPAAAPNTKRTIAPVMCERNDNIKLDGVVIETNGVAITTQGNCRLTVTNSKLVSTRGAAVQTMGSSVVTFDNVEVVGKWGSIMNAGSANVTIRRGTLRGRLGVEGSSQVKLETSQVWGGRSVTSSATYFDGGGNTFHK